MVLNMYLCHKHLSVSSLGRTITSKKGTTIPNCVKAIWLHHIGLFFILWLCSSIEMGMALANVKLSLVVIKTFVHGQFDHSEHMNLEGSIRLCQIENLSEKGILREEMAAPIKAFHK